MNQLSRPAKHQSAAATPAFWQLPPNQQPFFLRAVSLEINRKWDALAALGEHWTKQSPTNPRAWLVLETALQQLHRLEDAAFARDEARRLRLIQARQELPALNVASSTDVVADVAGAGQSVSASFPNFDP